MSGRVGALAILAALILPAVVQAQEHNLSAQSSYDPNPGPYIIFPRENGSLDKDQHNMIQNIISAWDPNLAPNLGHFHICYYSGSSQGSLSKSQIYERQQAALHSTASALAAAGAISVTTDQNSICTSLPRPYTKTEQPHVAVYGLLSLPASVK